MLVAPSQFLESQNLYEGPEEAERREAALVEIGEIVKGWVRGVYAAKGFPPSFCEDVNAAVFTFGSYRLGVHGPGEKLP